MTAQSRERRLPGLRAPEGKVLGAFENDRLVRDPDFGQGNTEIVRVDVVAGQSVEAPSFKITGALDVIAPGAEGAEEVSAQPVFSWVDDSGEDRYAIEVYDALGRTIWTDSNIPGSSGSNPEVPYGGPALQQGMFYQLRVTSFDVNDRPLSRTEDLKGVFFLR